MANYPINTVCYKNEHFINFMDQQTKSTKIKIGMQQIIMKINTSFDKTFFITGMIPNL